MSKSLASDSVQRTFLLAAAIAAVAAILLVAVWGPLQARAFQQATSGVAPPLSWTRLPFQTDSGTAARLEDSNGRVRIVTMLYTHCPGSCPLSVWTLQSLESRLSAQERSALSVVALTLDPERDNVETLHSYRMARHLDPTRWTLGRASTADTRIIGTQLNINSRVNEDGTIDHPGIFILLDRDGNEVARSVHTGSIDPQFLRSVQAALARG